MGDIKHIIFDMGGVLIDLDRDASVEAFSRIGFPEAERMLSSYHPGGVFAELEMGELSTAQFHDRIREQAGKDIPDDEIDRAFHRFLVGLPVYKLEMIRNLRHRFSINMLSNTNAVMLPYIRDNFFTQEGLTFEDYFDSAFLSFEMGVMKPDPEIYRMMCLEGGFSPEECLFIDDSRTNTEVADTLGFNTYCPAAGEDFRRIFDGL